MSRKWLPAVLQDRGEEESAEECGRVLVVSGGDPSPLFEPSESSFDRVAVLVPVDRKGWWSTTPAATGQPMLNLIDSFRNGAGDPATA